MFRSRYRGNDDVTKTVERTEIDTDAHSDKQKQREQARQGRIVSPTRPAQLWIDNVGVVATRSIQFLLILIAGCIIVFGLLRVSLVVVPFLLALILASAFEPVIGFLSRRKWPRLLSTVLVLLTVLVLFGGLLSLVVVQVIEQWGQMSEAAVKGFNQLVSWWNDSFPQLALNQENLEELAKAAQSLAANLNYGAVGTGVAQGLTVFGTFVAGAVLFGVILFFFLKDGPKLWNFTIRPLPSRQHRRAELMGARAVSVLGGYVRGTVIVALVDAIFIGVGMLIIGVPLWLPLALVVFICAFIPVVGATLAGIVAALVTLVTNGLGAAIAVTIIVTAVNQIEGNLLQPIVLGRSLKLHELVVLIALTTGTVLGGILGTLIAVPLTAVAWSLIKAWNEPLPDLEAEQEEDTIRSRLRERWQRRDRESA